VEHVTNSTWRPVYVQVIDTRLSLLSPHDCSNRSIYSRNNLLTEVSELSTAIRGITKATHKLNKLPVSHPLPTSGKLEAGPSLCMPLISSAIQPAIGIGLREESSFLARYWHRPKRGE